MDASEVTFLDRTEWQLVGALLWIRNILLATVTI